MSNEKAIEILTSAKEKVEAGWVKNTFSRASQEGTSYCSYGAIVTSYEEGRQIGIYDYTNREVAIHAMDKLSGGNIIAFNDHPKTTKEDVLKLFDKAIKNIGPKKWYQFWRKS